LIVSRLVNIYVSSRSLLFMFHQGCRHELMTVASSASPVDNSRLADHAEQCVTGRGRSGGRQMRGSFSVSRFSNVVAGTVGDEGFEECLPAPSYVALI
jgi:hypothetical protein